MFKVISAEFKKILSKPGIFILSIFLALILVIGVFIYNPKLQDDNTLSFRNATNYLDKYALFIGDDETNKTAGIKVEADNQVKLAIENINNYSINSYTGNISQEENIHNLLDDINEKYKEYVDCSIDGLDSTITKTRNDLIQSFENLNAAIVSANINAANGSYSLVMTKSVYKTYKNQYEEILAWAKTTISKDKLADHCNVYKAKYKDDFLNNISKFVYPTLSSSFVKDFTTDSGKTKLNTLNIRLEAIMDEINTNFVKAQSSASKNIELSSKMNKLAQDYVDTCNTYTNLIKYSLINNALAELSTTEQMNALYLSDYSIYNCKSLQVRYNFLFDENKTENDYAKPLTIGSTSNNDINAYDYAYFVLKLFSFVIIAFSIMSACHTIAGEIKDGSMRYLAIRPVSRTKILFGKMFSILILATILSIFSGIIAIAVGGAVYGFESLSILTIFNGSVALEMHPIAMIATYLISLLLEITVYTSIAILLSSIFKSDLLSVTLMLLLYLINTILPVFVTGMNSWLTFYPFAHICLYSLFGSSVYSIQGNFLNALLGVKVYLTTNVILTSVTTLLLILIPCFIANKIFNNKEL